MLIFCTECGYRGEMNGHHFSSRTLCPKCGLPGLDRETLRGVHVESGRAIMAEEYSKMPKQSLAETGSEPQELVESGKKESIIKQAEKVIREKSGRDKVKELVASGKTFEEIVKVLQGQLAISSIESYFCHAGGRRPRHGGAPLGNKNGTRGQKGEHRKCLDCGVDIYVTPWRRNHPTSENSGKRCRHCAIKFVRDTRQPKGRRLMRRNVVDHIKELERKFLGGEPSEYKAGAVYACNLIIEFVEKKVIKTGEK